MFIKVGDSKILKTEKVDEFFIKLDTSLDHCAYAIYYRKKYQTQPLVHYPREQMCKESLAKILESLNNPETYCCEIPGEYPTIYKSIDVTTTSGTVRKFKYCPGCVDQFIDQFYIHRKHDTYRIKHTDGWKITGKYKNLSLAEKDLTAFIQAVRDGASEYTFTLGNVSGVWYTKEDYDD